MTTLLALFVFSFPTPLSSHQTPAPWAHVKSGCVRCSDKCSQCKGGVGCVENCIRYGNPMLVATCGVRREC